MTSAFVSAPTGAFQLDYRLADSSIFIEEWDLCRVALKNDKTWPWLYLVPRRNDIREICDLTAADQEQLMREISTASRALQEIYSPDKINVAALGNMVPQLHVHVFARFRNDPAWPKPVWAVQLDEISYTDPEIKTGIEKLKNYFGRIRDTV